METKKKSTETVELAPVSTNMVVSELSRIQRELKAPKGQYNSFGKYKYRSQEDILEGIKKVKGDCSVTLQDEIVMVGDRIYVKATATLVAPDGNTANCNGWAREADQKKGMDSAQVTGATSSYARKYALNGLFAIDDTKDSDSETVGEDQSEQATSKQCAEVFNRCSELGVDLAVFCKYVGCANTDELVLTTAQYRKAMTALDKKAKQKEGA